MTNFLHQFADIEQWMGSPRFDGIERLHTAREVVMQKGAIATDYVVARESADGFYDRLRELFNQRKSITTFGPYSPGQAVTMKKLGLEGIYLGGWATSAKGSFKEDPGADLASYPLSQVPDEAGPIVRALLAADKNQHFARFKMTAEELDATPAVDFRPFIIADADTGHGGDAHVRNLVRRFVEVGVPGYHIEDQKPGVKKCGHQGGKVLVPVDEQIKRLNAARFQLDCMGVSGLIVARTDAESATFLDGCGDERDQPFILGATNVTLPSYKLGFAAILRRLHELGLEEVRGHLLFAISEDAYEAAYSWLTRSGLMAAIEKAASNFQENRAPTVDPLLDELGTRYVDLWQVEAGLKTYAQAIADLMEFRSSEGDEFEMSVGEWTAFAERASLYSARKKARTMGLQIIWDCELPKTPEGYYQIRGGINYAIEKSLGVAPFADLLWMETKTANLADAREFAEAIHARFPEKMLAYNLSPSFNWDTTGMNDDEMRNFPEELGKLGYVFNFITYGGHQIDGLAAEEFATALSHDGMLALARLQRKLRLRESPFRTPQTLVGGPRLDGALMASTGRTATTKAMGKGSTQFQHLIHTEVPPKVLEEWFQIWSGVYETDPLRVELRPHVSGSDLIELSVLDKSKKKIANVIFGDIVDRRGHNILSIRDQNTFEESYRQKRLMTIVHLFLIHRYKAFSVHYLSPTQDNEYQTRKMEHHGLFSDVHSEVGHIIVAEVDAERVAELLNPDLVSLTKLVDKTEPKPSSRR